MEMSTQHFKTFGKRLNSERVDDSGKSREHPRAGKPPVNKSASERKKTQSRETVDQKKSHGSYESKYTLIDISEDKMRHFVMGQLRHFDCRTEYDEMVFYEDSFVVDPSENEIADYCKYVTISCKMETEIPVVCLVYIEKLLLNTGILLNKWNWRRVTLICLCLASKIWDDDSLENVHFPKVMRDVTNFEINKLEQVFLEFIDYQLVIRSGQYAKYYFILRTLANEVNRENGEFLSPFENRRRRPPRKGQAVDKEWAEFPLRAPISAEKMAEL